MNKTNKIRENFMSMRITAILLCAVLTVTTVFLTPVRGLAADAREIPINDLNSDGILTAGEADSALGLEGIIRYANDGAAFSVIIANGVTHIGEDAFRGFALTNVIIPDSVISIAGGAFSKTLIKNISLPKSVVLFPETDPLRGPFTDMSGLETITLQTGTTAIGGNEFAGIGSGVKINIPRTVTAISGDSGLIGSAATVWVYEGSYAQTYAIENRLNYKSVPARYSEIPSPAYEHVPYSLSVEAAAGSGLSLISEDLPEDFSIDYYRKAAETPRESSYTVDVAWEGVVLPSYPEVSFNPAIVLGQVYGVLPDTNVAISANPISPTVDDMYEYTFELTTVTVDSVAEPGFEANFVAVADTAHEVTFVFNVTRTPRPSQESSYVLRKEWEGDELPEGTAYPIPTFGSGVVLDQVYSVKAGAQIVIPMENPIPDIEVGDILYSFELTGITIDEEYISWPVNGPIEFTAIEDTLHEITYHNTVTAHIFSSSYTVDVEWQGVVPPVYPDVWFNPETVLGQEYSVLPGMNIVIEAEPILPIYDEWYEYTFELIEVTVDAELEADLWADFDTVADTKHEVRFVYNVTRGPLESHYIIRNVWEGDTLPYGIEYPVPTFTPEIELDQLYDVNAGDQITIPMENPIEDIVIGNGAYSFELTGVTVDGEYIPWPPENDIVITAVAGMWHEIMYHNTVSAPATSSSYTVNIALEGDELPGELRVQFNPETILGQKYPVIPGTIVVIRSYGWGWSGDGLYDYTVDLIRIMVDNSEEPDRQANFEVIEDTAHEVVFVFNVTRIPRITQYTVSKEWLGDPIPAELLPEPIFDPEIVLGQEYTVDSGTNVVINEEPMADVQDELYDYTFTLTRVTVNGSNEANLTADFTTSYSRDYEVIFYNTVIRTPREQTPRESQYTVRKEWLGDPIPAELLPVPTFAPDTVLAEASRVDASINLNQAYIVDADTNIAIKENPIAGVQDDLYNYTFTLVRVTVDGVDEPDLRADFTALAEANHEIVFYNNVTRTLREAQPSIDADWIEVRGIPKAPGVYHFTVAVTADDNYNADEELITYEITVRSDPTRAELDAYNDFVIETYIGVYDEAQRIHVLTINEANPADVLWELEDRPGIDICYPDNFFALWIDGEEVAEANYRLEEGSTRIIIDGQTFIDYTDGETHIISAEFNVDGKYYQGSQNFRVTTTSGSSGNGSSGGGSSGAVSSVSVSTQRPSGENPDGNSSDTTTPPDEIPVPEPPSGLPFEDVLPPHWFYDEVEWVYYNRIMVGVSPTRFAPQSPATPAMLAVTLAKLSNANLSEYQGVGDTWYSSALAWAKATGLIDDSEEMTPDAALDRGQVMIIIARYLALVNDIEATGTDRTFVDQYDMTANEVIAFQTLTELQIVVGRGDGIMAPRGKATRAELATLLKNIGQLI